MTLTDTEYKKLLDAQPVIKEMTGSRELRFIALEAQQKVNELLSAYVKQERKEAEATAPF